MMKIIFRTSRCGCDHTILVSSGNDAGASLLKHLNFGLLRDVHKHFFTLIFNWWLDLPVLRYYCDSENDSGNTIVKDSI